MQVSIASWGCRKWFDEGRCDLVSFVDEVKRLEADGLEIWPPHVDPDNPRGQLIEVARRAAEVGLAISAVMAPGDFAQPRAAERAEKVEQVKDWIAYTAEAGVPRMVSFTGTRTSGEDPFLEAWRVVDAYRELAPVAEEHGVLLCIENNSVGSSVCADADSLLSIIRAAGSKAIRTCPDPDNFLPNYRTAPKAACERIYTETEKVARLMANAHLKIAEFTEDGDDAHLDVPRLLDIFRSAGYDGHVVLEYYGDGDPEEPCAKGTALLRRLLGQA